MKELIITTFEGYSLAKILFTISAVVLISIFFSLVIVSIIKYFFAKTKKKLEYWDKQERSLVLCLIIVFGFLILSIVLHYIMPIFGIPMPLT